MPVQIETAQASIDELVQHVLHGENVELVKDGRVIGKVISNQPSERTAEQQVEIERALRGLDQLAAKAPLGAFDFDEFKRFRDEGRP